jgi:iron complex transport system substrate-binding protein
MATATRIVSLISSATEILYLLGLGDLVVGVSHECDFPADVARKPRLTRALVDSAATSGAIDEQVRTLAASHSALYAIDAEELAALRPDVIITQAQCDVCAVRYEDVLAAVHGSPALQGAKVLALNPASIWEVLQDVGRVAAAVGTREAIALAPALDDQLRNRLRAVEAGSRELAGDRPRVICLEWIEPPMVAGNWMPELVAMAGGGPGLSQQGVHSPYVDWPAIVNYDPQVIVIMPCGFDLERSIVEAQVLAALPGWSEMSAVRDGRVFAVDGNAYFNRSGPRLVDSVEILAHLFHPNRFAPPSGVAGRAFRRLTTQGNALMPAT